MHTRMKILLTTTATTTWLRRKEKEHDRKRKPTQPFVSVQRYSKVLLLLLSRFSHVRLLATPWTAAYQAPPSMGFSRQEQVRGAIAFTGYSKVRAHNTTPQILTLKDLQSSCSCITQKQCTIETSRGIGPGVLDLFLGSVTLDTSLNLTERFSFLVYKMRTIPVISDHKVLYLCIKATRLKMFLQQPLLLLLCQGLSY